MKSSGLITPLSLINQIEKVSNYTDNYRKFYHKNSIKTYRKVCDIFTELDELKTLPSCHILEGCIRALSSNIDHIEIIIKIHECFKDKGDYVYNTVCIESLTTCIENSIIYFLQHYEYLPLQRIYQFIKENEFYNDKIIELMFSHFRKNISNSYVEMSNIIKHLHNKPTRKMLYLLAHSYIKHKKFHEAKALCKNDNYFNQESNNTNERDSLRIKVYGSCGNINKACKIYNAMKYMPDAGTNNNMMKAYIDNDMINDAEKIYNIALRTTNYNSSTHTIMMEGYKKEGNLIEAEQLFNTIIQKQISKNYHNKKDELNKNIFHILITAFGENNNFKKCCEYYDLLQNKFKRIDYILIDAMIQACIRCNQHNYAEKIYNQNVEQINKIVRICEIGTIIKPITKIDYHGLTGETAAIHLHKYISKLRLSENGVELQIIYGKADYKDTHPLKDHIIQFLQKQKHENENYDLDFNEDDDYGRVIVTICKSKRNYSKAKSYSPRSENPSSENIQLISYASLLKKDELEQRQLGKKQEEITQNQTEEMLAKHKIKIFNPNAKSYVPSTMFQESNKASETSHVETNRQGTAPRQIPYQLPYDGMQSQKTPDLVPNQIPMQFNMPSYTGSIHYPELSLPYQQLPYGFIPNQMPVPYQIPYAFIANQMPMPYQMPYGFIPNQMPVPYQQHPLYGFIPNQMPLAYQPPYGFAPSQMQHEQVSYSNQAETQPSEQINQQHTVATTNEQQTNNSASLNFQFTFYNTQKVHQKKKKKKSKKKQNVLKTDFVVQQADEKFRSQLLDQSNDEKFPPVEELQQSEELRQDESQPVETLQQLETLRQDEEPPPEELQQDDKLKNVSSISYDYRDIDFFGSQESAAGSEEEEKSQCRIF